MFGNQLQKLERESKKAANVFQKMVNSLQSTNKKVEKEKVKKQPTFFKKWLTAYNLLTKK